MNSSANYAAKSYLHVTRERRAILVGYTLVSGYFEEMVNVGR
jgi:hypothetical protein